MKLIATIALASISSSIAFTCLPPTAGTGRAAALKGTSNDDVTLTRRETLESWFVGVALAAGTLATPQDAMAFDNRISNKYDDRPKQRGSKPPKLGVAMRQDYTSEEYLGLRPCGAAPNCFCSTDSVEDSPETNMPPFKWDTKQLSSREDAFQQLYEVVKAYQPGQSEIDGGGFDIVAFDPKAGYMYVQFQSLKNGYIDDFELAAVGDDNTVQVRSSSRLGWLDFGVNAQRINFIAKALRAKGWDAPGVEVETHQGYAAENGIRSF